MVTKHLKIYLEQVNWKKIQYVQNLHILRMMVKRIKINPDSCQLLLLLITVQILKEHYSIGLAVFERFEIASIGTTK